MWATLLQGTRECISYQWFKFCRTFYMLQLSWFLTDWHCVIISRTWMPHPCLEFCWSWKALLNHPSHYEQSALPLSVLPFMTSSFHRWFLRVFSWLTIFKYFYRTTGAKVTWEETLRQTLWNIPFEYIESPPNYIVSSYDFQPTS
jgi:hypothetical protein